MFILGYVLVGNVMEMIFDVEEFECWFKCIGKNGCKLVNVYFYVNNE